MDANCMLHIALENFIIIIYVQTAHNHEKQQRIANLHARANHQPRASSPSEEMYNDTIEIEIQPTLQQSTLLERISEGAKLENVGDDDDDAMKKKSETNE